MIDSMTGFGEACQEVEGIVYTVEIRTVNNRYLKAQMRLPDIAAFLESPVEKLIRKQIHRGTVNYSLRMKNISGKALFEIDENAVENYVSKLRAIAEQNSTNCRIDLAGILTLPSVVQPATPDENTAQKMEEVVLGLTGNALEQVKQMRSQEGKSLAEDMLSNCRETKEKLDLIEQRSPAVVEEYHDKLKKRAEDLLAGTKLDVDPEILAREVALFADRSDIAEEVARLNSHLQQFSNCCENGQNVGRRLDFISQEMLRETNTIASKASDAQICQWVIDIKCAIDRIKEQIQNVE